MWGSQITWRFTTFKLQNVLYFVTKRVWISKFMHCVTSNGGAWIELALQRRIRVPSNLRGATFAKFSFFLTKWNFFWDSISKNENKINYQTLNLKHLTTPPRSSVCWILISTSLPFAPNISNQMLCSFSKLWLQYEPIFFISMLSSWIPRPQKKK